MGIGWNKCCNCYYFNWNWAEPFGISPGFFLDSIGNPAGWHGGTAGAGWVVTYSGGGSTVALKPHACTLENIFELIFNNFPDGSTCRIYMGCAPGATTSNNYVEWHTTAGADTGYYVAVGGGVPKYLIASNHAGFGGNISAGLFHQPTCDEWIISLVVNLQDVSFPSANNYGGLLVPGAMDLRTGFPGSALTRHVGCCSTIITQIVPESSIAGTSIAIHLSGTDTISILYAAGGNWGAYTLGYYEHVNFAGYEANTYCSEIAQDCGCCDCNLYISCSGIEPSGDIPCSGSFSGTHALKSLGGALNAQNGLQCNNCNASGVPSFHTCAWGCLIGTADGECCGAMMVTMTYDQDGGTGTTFNGYVATSTTAYPSCDGSLPSGFLEIFGYIPPLGGIPQDCMFGAGGGGVLVFSTNIPYGADSVTGGRLDCGSLSEIGMTVIEDPPTLDGFSIEGGATMGIFGSDSDPCPDIDPGCAYAPGGDINPCLYEISAILTWTQCIDFDLYAADYGNSSCTGTPAVCWYGATTVTSALGTLSLTTDANCGTLECEGGIDPPVENISGIYNASDCFYFWYAYFANCSEDDDSCAMRPSSFVITVTNTGSADITVNGSTVTPSSHIDITGPTDPAGTSCLGTASPFDYAGPKWQQVQVVCGGE